MPPEVKTPVQVSELSRQLEAMHKSPKVKTPAQARAWFTNHGICITDWCREKQLNRLVVTDLLRGRGKGLRGEAHRAAVALGLKPDPSSLQE